MVITQNTYKFKKLLVWEKSIDYITLIYKITQDFPKLEQFGLTDQIRRAAVSICLNIAEGSGSGSDLEFRRFLKISQRSAFEVVAALEISLRLGYGKSTDIKDAILKVSELSAMLTGLIKKLTANS